MAVMPLREQSRGTASFETLATEILRRVRSSLAAVIGGLPQASAIRKPADLQRELRIHSKLAWQVHRLANAADPVTEATNLPRSQSMQRFLTAARDHGVESEIVNAANRALDELDDLIATHATDHATFETMLCGISDGGAEQTDWTHRRAAFRAQSHILGAQARTQLCSFLYNASATHPDMLDAASIRGKVNLRRFRRDALLTIAGVGVANARTSTEPIVHEPIHGCDNRFGLMRQFSTDPLPTLRSVCNSKGVTHLLLTDDSVGNESAFTCFMGDVTRRVFSRYARPNDTTQISQAMVRWPCEVLLVDVASPVGLFVEGEPKLELYSDQRSGDASVLDREYDRLPFYDTATLLGRGVNVMHTPDIPQYAEMMKYTFDQLGWDASEFEVWRCRVEYPVVPSSLSVQHRLTQGTAEQ